MGGCLWGSPGQVRPSHRQGLTQALGILGWKGKQREGGREGGENPELGKGGKKAGKRLSRRSPGY